MAFGFTIGVTLLESDVGLPLRATLLDTDGHEMAGHVAISTGFAEIGQGYYLWSYDNFPDWFRGAVKFYSNGNPSQILAVLTLNPEESSYVAYIKNQIDQNLQQQIIMKTGTTNPAVATLLDGQDEDGGGTVVIRKGSIGSESVSTIETGVSEGADDEHTAAVVQNGADDSQSTPTIQTGVR